jgi:hypothetical protein
MYPMMPQGMVQPVGYQGGYYGYRPMAPGYYGRQMYPQTGGSFPNAFFGGN